MNETAFTEDQLQEALDRRDLNANIRTDYSGRGMFKRTCFGIITADPQAVVFALIDALVESGNGLQGALDDAEDLMKDSRTDSMAFDAIVYFPGWKLLDEGEDEEEEEE